MSITFHQATKVERALYCSQVTHSMTVAWDGEKVLGFCEWKGDTIFVIESFHKGAGAALVRYLAHIRYAADVCCVAEPFWEKMGFESIDGSRTWRRMV